MKKSKVLLASILAASAVGLSACKKETASQFFDEIFVENTDVEGVKSFSAISSTNEMERQNAIVAEIDAEGITTYTNVFTGKVIGKSTDGIISVNSSDCYYYVIKLDGEKFKHSIYGYTEDQELLSFTDDVQATEFAINEQISNVEIDGETLELHELCVINENEDKFYVTYGEKVEYHTERPEEKRSSKFGYYSAKSLGADGFYFDQVSLENDMEKLYFYDENEELISTLTLGNNVQSVVYVDGKIIYQEVYYADSNSTKYDVLFNMQDFGLPMEYKMIVNSYSFDIQKGKIKELDLEYMINDEIESNENSEFAAVSATMVDSSTKNVMEETVLIIDNKGKIEARYDEFVGYDSLNFRSANGGFFIDGALYNSNMEFITNVDSKITNGVYIKSINNKTLLIGENGEALKSFEDATVTEVANGIISVTTDEAEEYYEITSNSINKIELAENAEIVNVSYGLYAICEEQEDGSYKFTVKYVGLSDTITLYSDSDSIIIDDEYLNDVVVLFVSEGYYLDAEMTNELFAIKLNA